MRRAARYLALGGVGLATLTPSPARGSHLLFLNRCPDGLTVSPGVDDARVDTSSTLTRAITLSPFEHGDASWAEIVADVSAMFAPFDITVTDVDPSPAPHDEVVICGTAQEADAAPGTVGFAAWSCTPIPNAMTFVLPGTIGDFPRYTAETAAQEAAHAWGLDHVFDCRDPMTYLDPCGPKRFLDEDVPCGEYEPRACECGGSTQNGHQRIVDLFGASMTDTMPPGGTGESGGGESEGGESEGGESGGATAGETAADGDRGGCRVANSDRPRPAKWAAVWLLLLVAATRMSRLRR